MLGGQPFDLAEHDLRGPCRFDVALSKGYEHFASPHPNSLFLVSITTPLRMLFAAPTPYAVRDRAPDTSFVVSPICDYALYAIGAEKLACHEALVEKMRYVLGARGGNRPTP